MGLACLTTSAQESGLQPNSATGFALVCVTIGTRSNGPCQSAEACTQSETSGILTDLAAERGKRPVDGSGSKAATPHVVAANAAKCAPAEPPHSTTCAGSTPYCAALARRKRMAALTS